MVRRMICVIAKLDDSATAELTSVIKRAFPADKVIKPIYGHITIASYIGNDEDCFVRSCMDKLGGGKSFDVCFEKIVVLAETSIIAAIPKRSEQIDDLYNTIEKMFGNDLDKWSRKEYRCPHTTLYYDPQSDLEGICSLISGSFVPFFAKVRAIEFSRVADNGYDIIARLPMKQ